MYSFLVYKHSLQLTLKIISGLSVQDRAQVTENFNRDKHQNRFHLWPKFNGNLAWVTKKIMNIKDTILDLKNWVFLHFQTRWKHTVCFYKSKIQDSKCWIKAYKWFSFTHLWSCIWLLFGAISTYVKYLYEITACETTISAWVNFFLFKDIVE